VATVTCQTQDFIVGCGNRAAAKNIDFKIDVIGGSGSPLGSSV
jgi:hypothetical protein